MGQAEWVTVPISTRDVEGPIHFSKDEWDTIEAATARIIPTDHHPGAREAKVVRFIDRMLAGTQFVFPAADGIGWLRMEGLEEKAWQERIALRQALYANGVKQLDEIARGSFGERFIDLADDQQDDVLEQISGKPKPTHFSFDAAEDDGLGGAPAGNQPVNEDFLDFFPLLVLNTRQGFYGDPVYGGNENRVGWA
ncbi:gluconate 2-dehydrogenase subunit 3 family protein, partial [Mycetocola sp.]|uniref:gluconate 2-dehydrogenase subunit 3 family protein n=1 Tax=Mycetocola sp. TaxID=1871042 RepID=UPI003989A739